MGIKNSKFIEIGLMKYFSKKLWSKNIEKSAKTQILYFEHSNICPSLFKVTFYSLVK
jgi:hypothetical protein